MARRYWVKIGRRKYYVGATLAELKAAAQNAANNLGRAVQVGFDDPRPRSANAGRPGSSARYQRNPAGRPPGRGDDWTGVRTWATVDHRGRVVTTHAYRIAAEAHARKWGLTIVPAHYEAGRLVLDSGRPATFKRNPDPGSFLPLWNEQEKHRAARLARNKASRPRRLAKGLRGRRGDPDAVAPPAKSAKFIVEARSGRDAYTLFQPSRRAADRLAADFTAAGYAVNVRPA